MEKEKNKSKSHPFAGHLRSTEDVLWMSGQANQTSMRTQLKTWGAILAGVIGVVIFSTVIDSSLKANERGEMILGITFFTTIVFGIIGLLVVLYRAVRGTRAPERIYAVTNERLLYRSKKNVIVLPLEAMPSISLFLGEGTKGTFSFGAFFPMWPDVEDAVMVKRLIDDAQKQRLKEIAA